MSRYHEFTRRQLKYLSRDAMLEEAGPPYLGTAAILLVVGLLMAALVWSHYVQVTTATQAQGEVVPPGDERVVQHLEGGIVKAVKVRDGDLVRAGQVLIQFEPALRGAELDQVRARKAALEIRSIRLKALIDGSEPDFGLHADIFPDLVSEATFSLNAQRERIAGQQAVLESRINQREKSRDIFQNQMDSLGKQRGLVQESVTMRQSLFNSGHGSRVNLINAQLELARVDGQIAEAKASADQAEVAIDEARNQLAELLVTEKDAALEELTQVGAELAEVRESVARLQDRFRRLNVAAPIAGVVHDLDINTNGAVVEPAQVLMKIVPRDEAVVVDARIDPKDIGHVLVGQNAKVTVSGFDARRYGSLTGRLTKISANSFTDEEGMSFFKGRVELDAQAIAGPSGRHELLPGMTVQADIVTGSQTLLSYLTGPIHSALSRTFSER